MKKSKRPITLRRETIRALTDLGSIVGGLITNKTIECPSVTATCGSECGFTCAVQSH